MTRLFLFAVGPALLVAAATAGEPATVTISDAPQSDIVTVASFLGGPACDAACDVTCDTTCEAACEAGCGPCGSAGGCGPCGSGGCKPGLFGHGRGYAFGDLGAYGFGSPYDTYGYVGPFAGLHPLGAGHCKSCPNSLGLLGAGGLGGIGAVGGAHGQLGFLASKGCCGYGCGPAGKYGLVYAVDPFYTDPRDGTPYAAAATNLPMAVPTAPTVRHTYNYGWGVPSSRITPLYRHAPEAAAVSASPRSFVVPGSERVLGPTAE